MLSYEYWKKQQPAIVAVLATAAEHGVEKEINECLLKEYSKYQMTFAHP